MAAMIYGNGCSESSPPTPEQPKVEVLRTANRLAANEGKSVVLEGLAVRVAGRACIHLDRTDAIVPVADRAAWGSELDGLPVRGRGVLTRHAARNDPDTGLSSLELSDASVESITIPNDGRIRIARALRAANGKVAAVEGMAYRSRNGPIIVVYGGLAYVRDLPRWDEQTVEQIVVVHGTVRSGRRPPEAPAAGGNWYIDATGFDRIP